MREEEKDFVLAVNYISAENYRLGLNCVNFQLYKQLYSNVKAGKLNTNCLDRSWIESRFHLGSKNKFKKFYLRKVFFQKAGLLFASL